MYVCNCSGLTEADIRAFRYAERHSTGADRMLGYVLKQEGKCCKCLPQIKEIFNEPRTPDRTLACPRKQ